MFERVPQSRRLGARGAWALIIGACLLGLVHAGTVANYAYPVIACAVAILLLRAKRDLDYLEFALWLWLVDPGVRRIVDYGSHYHANSPVIITAELVSLVGLFWTVPRRGAVYREVRAAVAVVVPVLGFGLVSGVVHSDVKGALSDLLFYGAPIALGVWLLLAPVNRADVLHRLYQVAVPALLVLGGYGIVQFVHPPSWDVAWITNSGITAVGVAAPFQIRVFSLLDTAGPFGQTMTVLLLIAMQPVPRPSWLRRLAIGVGLVGLGLSLSRQAWLALALGVVLLIWNRRILLTRLVLSIAALAVLLGLFGGPVRDAITGRLSHTVQAGSSDTSFLARTRFQAEIAPAALSNLAGQGLGSTGVATKLAGNQAGPDSALISSFDSGIFEIIYTFGSIAGLAFLVAVVRLAWRMGSRYLRRGPPAPAFLAVAIIGLTFGLLFTNTMKAIYGADFWILVGAIRSPAAYARLTRPLRSEPAAAPALPARS